MVFKGFEGWDVPRLWLGRNARPRSVYSRDASQVSLQLGRDLGRITVRTRPKSDYSRDASQVSLQLGRVPNQITVGTRPSWFRRVPSRFTVGLDMYFKVTKFYSPNQI